MTRLFGTTGSRPGQPTLTADPALRLGAAAAAVLAAEANPGPAGRVLPPLAVVGATRGVRRNAEATSAGWPASVDVLLVEICRPASPTSPTGTARPWAR